MARRSFTLPCEGRVATQSWAGYSTARVTVLKETPKRFKVRWEDESAFRGRFYPGKIFYVPKHVLTIIQRGSP